MKIMHAYSIDAAMAPTPKLDDDDAAWARFEDDCSLFLLSFVVAAKGDEALLRQGVTMMALYLLFLVHVGETRPHCFVVVGGEEEGGPSLRLAEYGSESVHATLEELMATGSKFAASAAAAATSVVSGSGAVPNHNDEEIT